MKRIFLISNMYPSESQPFYGVFVKNFEDSLNPENFKIASRSVIKGRGKSVLGKLFKYILFFIDVIIKGIFTRYDIVYVHYINHTSMPVLLLRILRSKPKLILNAHGGDIVQESRFAKLIFPVSKLVINKASLIVVPSIYFKKEVENILPVHSNKKFCVSPSGGIDMDIFFPVSEVKNTDVIILGFIGRIDAGKGWDLFLYALSKLSAENNLKFRGYVVGDGAQIKEFFSLIDTLQIGFLIDYHKRVPQKELRLHYEKIDVFIFPSRQESLGLVGLEAMACGIPVIGSNIDGIKSYLEDEVNGFLFETQNVQSLVESITQYAQLDAQAKGIMRSNALSKASQFDKQIVAKKLNDAILGIFEQ